MIQPRYLIVFININCDQLSKYYFSDRWHVCKHRDIYIIRNTAFFCDEVASAYRESFLKSSREKFTGYYEHETYFARHRTLHRAPREKLAFYLFSAIDLWKFHCSRTAAIRDHWNLRYAVILWYFSVANHRNKLPLLCYPVMKRNSVLSSYGVDAKN